MTDQIVNGTQSLWIGLTQGFSSLMNFIPTLLGGLLVLVVGWYLSSLIAKLIEKALTVARFERVADASGVRNYLPMHEGRHISVSHALATLAKWFFRLIFIQAAANVFGMPQVTTIINEIVLFIPRLAVGLLILLAGAALSRLLGQVVRESALKAGIGNPGIFSAVARYAVIGFSVIAAANQVGIAVFVVNALLIGLISSIALALGLAFGLGGKDVASEISRDWYGGTKELGAQVRSIRKPTGTDEQSI